MPSREEVVAQVDATLAGAREFLKRSEQQQLARRAGASKKEKRMPEIRWDVDDSLVNPNHPFLALRGGRGVYEAWVWEAIKAYVDRAGRDSAAFRNMAEASRERIEELIPAKREQPTREAAERLAGMIEAMGRDAAAEVAKRDRAIEQVEGRILNETTPPERDAVSESRASEIRRALQGMGDAERMQWVAARAHAGDREALFAVIDSPIDLVPADWLEGFRRKAAFALAPALREMEVGMALLRDRTLEVSYLVHAEIRRALVDFNFEQVGFPGVEAFAGLEEAA